MFLLPRVCKRKRIDKQSDENLKELVAVAKILFNNDEPRIIKNKKIDLISGSKWWYGEVEEEWERGEAK